MCSYSLRTAFKDAGTSHQKSAWLSRGGGWGTSTASATSPFIFKWGKHWKDEGRNKLYTHTDKCQAKHLLSSFCGVQKSHSSAVMSNILKVHLPSRNSVLSLSCWLRCHHLEFDLASQSILKNSSKVVKGYLPHFRLFGGLGGNTYLHHMLWMCLSRLHSSWYLREGIRTEGTQALLKLRGRGGVVMI